MYYFIDFDGTITGFDIPYAGSLWEFWGRRLQVPVNMNIYQLLKYNNYRVLTNNLKIERFNIRKYLKKFEINDRCDDIICVNNFFRFKKMTKRGVAKKKAKVIFDFLRDKEELLKKPLEELYTYIDSDIEETRYVNLEVEILMHPFTYKYGG